MDSKLWILLTISFASAFISRSKNFLRTFFFFVSDRFLLFRILSKVIITVSHRPCFERLPILKSKGWSCDNWMVFRCCGKMFTLPSWGKCFLFSSLNFCLCAESLEGQLLESFWVRVDVDCVGLMGISVGFSRDSWGISLKFHGISL